MQSKTVLSSYTHTSVAELRDVTTCLFCMIFDLVKVYLIGFGDHMTLAVLDITKRHTDGSLNES